MKKLRAAIVGAGLMGRWHAHALTRAGGEVALVCDRDNSAAHHLANGYKSARAVTRPEGMCSPGEIDVLHVCTPLNNHFELASDAVTRGVHVLVEKPMTSSCTETKRLYLLAQEHGVLLCPVHQFLFQRGVRRALAEFDSVGRLRHFEATFCSAGGAGKDGAELDAIVAEILPHPLSLIQLFAPESLRNAGWMVNRSVPGEFRAVLTAQEICFSILISLNSRPTSSTLRLLGATGTIHVDLFHGFCVIEPGTVSRWRKIIHPFDLAARTLFVAGANLGTRAWNAEPAYPGLRELIKSFYSAISLGAAPPIAPEDAIEIAAVRDLLSKTDRAPAPHISHY